MRCPVRLLLGAAVAAAACSRPISRGRTTVAEPPSAAEIDASERLRGAACPSAVGFLVPGGAQLCTGKVTEGAAIATLAVLEGSAAVVAATQVEVGPEDSKLEHPAVLIPLAGLQDLYVYGLSESYISSNLASRQLYTPTDSITDLLAAPFNIEVMRQPKVLGGLVGALAIGVAATFLIDSPDTDNAGGDPNIFGRRYTPATGYPLGLGIGAGLFTHVGIAEEALFRGVLQSALARWQGESAGLIIGSAVFGLAHAPNALALEGDDRRSYLLYAVPTITALGTYLSYLYMDSDYSLAPSTAVHFWYDFLLSGAFFVLSPDVSHLSARTGFSF